MITVYGNLSLNVGNFLSTVCPLKKSTKCDPKDIKVFLSQTLHNMDATFPDFIYQKFMQVTTWITKINGRVFKILEESDKNLDALCRKRAAIVIEGIELCNSIKRKTKQLLIMHTAFKHPLDKNLINAVV